MVRLQVYVEKACWSCAEARRIVADLGPQFPQVMMEVLDITAVASPPEVFAVPTYVLDGRIVFLGNPYRQDLHRLLQRALERQRM